MLTKKVIGKLIKYAMQQQQQTNMNPATNMQAQSNQNTMIAQQQTPLMQQPIPTPTSSVGMGMGNTQVPQSLPNKGLPNPVPQIPMNDPLNKPMVAGGGLNSNSYMRY